MQIHTIMVLISYHLCCDQSVVFQALVYVYYALFFFLMIQALFKVNNFQYE